MANFQASGQVTVATAGTAVQMTDAGYGIYYIKALAGNTGNVYVGNDNAGDVTSANGFELAAGDAIYYEGELNDLYADAATNGDKVCWFKSARV